MLGTDSIQVEGVVVEAFRNRTYRVELANGHQLLAFAPGKVRAAFAPIVAGEQVRLQLSPFDLSEGRILAVARPDPGPGVVLKKA